MPFLHEFGPDDIFINRLKMAPQYTFMGYSGSLYVNNISGTDGRGSIIGRNTPTGSISVNELNVDRIAISGSEVAMAATGTIEFATATAANVNGGTIVLTDGLGRTVLFQYDSSVSPTAPTRHARQTYNTDGVPQSDLLAGYHAISHFKIGANGNYTNGTAHATAVERALKLANGVDDPNSDAGDLAIDVTRDGGTLTLTQRLQTAGAGGDAAKHGGMAGNTPILIANSGSALASKTTEAGFGGGTNLASIFGYVVKDGNNQSFRNTTPSDYNELDYGTVITGAMPLTSSISRQYIYGGRIPPFRSRGNRNLNETISIAPGKVAGGSFGQTENSPDTGYHSTDTYFSQSKTLLALRNTIEKYRKYSPAFRFQTKSASAGSTQGANGTGQLITDDDPTVPPYMTGAINVIGIPSIFYGSTIERGSVDLKFYFSGTLLDRAKDERRNGELISTHADSQVSGSVVGVVLYDEGFILLYNEENISPNTKVTDSYSGTGSADAGGARTCDGTGVQLRANWTYFMSYNTGSSGSQGLGGLSPQNLPGTPHSPGVNLTPGGASRSDRCHAFFPSASHFSLSFRGKSITPTMTMFANAAPGELNNSQNPTWISSSFSSWKDQIHFDSSSYIEPKFMAIKNTVQSKHSNFEEDFEKQTFISKVGIYDENHNLLGIAKLATPVLKRETDSYTFKIKLDL